MMIKITSRIFSTRLDSPYSNSIQTDFDPAEIIAVRSDGTSESTNPEALRLRGQAAGLGIMDSYLAGRAELEPEVFRLGSERMALMVDRDAARSERDTYAQAINATKKAMLCQPYQCPEKHAKELYACLENAKFELKAAKALNVAALEAADAREAVQRVLHGVRPDLYESPASPCWCINENAELRADRDKIAGRLSKCREEKLALKAELEALNAKRLREIAEISRMPHVHIDEVKILKAELSQEKSDYSESYHNAMELARKNAIQNAELLKVSGELNRLTEIIEDQRVKLAHKYIMDRGA